MKRIALYARVSTDQQSTGLESQVRALKEFCQNQTWTNYELFADENFSGAKKSRPALDRMMNAVRNKEISHVVVYSFSRFARSTTHLLAALEEMKVYETDFISLTERIETNSPMGRAFFTVIAAIAQLERELIAERVKNGLRNARAKGKRIGREKMRDSDLIRKLLKAGLTYRAVSQIAKCSHGAVWAEKQAWLKELAEGKVDQLTVDPQQAPVFPEPQTSPAETIPQSTDVAQ